MPSKKIAFGKMNVLMTEVGNHPVSFIQFPDCFVERAFLSKLDDSFQKQYGASLTTMWLEDNVLSPGLFGACGPVVVLDCDQLPKQVMDFIEEADFPPDTKLIFSSSKKIKHKLLEKKYQFITFEPPKFWAMGDYIDFLADFFKLKISRDVTNYLLSILAGTPESFYNAVMILSAYPSNEINLKLAKSLFKASKIDNFSLADFFNQGNLKRLYLSLLIVEEDFDSYRSFFSFIQGHIIKIMDPSYSAKKSKLSKYDQGIIAASKRLSVANLCTDLEIFSELEILSKQKSRWLRDELRKGYLRS